MKMLKTIGFFVLAGAFFTTGYFFAQHTDSSESTATDSASSTPTLPAKPLYWVAPMDANYRRDKPGKSPMGMDLVPFYGTPKQAEAGVGTIRISPDVVNNLGVRSAAAFTGYLENAIRTVGYLAYNDDSLVHVHSRVEGWVEKSFVKSDGDFVEKGQPLFDLYSPALVNAQKEFVFALKRQDQSMISAGAARLSALNVSQVLIDELRSTRKVSQTVRFYAPQSGVIERLGVQEGFYIKPGTTLMSIVNLSEVWLNVDVFERQAHQVEIGQEVNATLAALPGKTFNSKVDFIYPELTEKERTLRVRVRLANPDRLLKPNMFAHVQIKTRRKQPALLIPKEALIRTGEQNRVVLALGDGQYKSLAVTVGALGDDYVAIQDGLLAGDKVVTSAQFLLDSESSKSSDFRRMSSQNERAQKTKKTPLNSTKDTVHNKDTVWVSARINRIDATTRSINVNHEAIVEWGWPKMTMTFTLAKDLVLDDLPIGRDMQLAITRQSDTLFVVTDFSDTDVK